MPPDSVEKQVFLDGLCSLQRLEQRLAFQQAAEQQAVARARQGDAMGDKDKDRWGCALECRHRINAMGFHYLVKTFIPVTQHLRRNKSQGA